MPEDTFGLPADIYAEVVYAVEHEFAYRPSDVLVRRTGRMFFNIDSVHNYKDGVQQLMADLLHYSEAEKERYRLEVEELLHDAAHFAKDGTYA